MQSKLIEQHGVQKVDIVRGHDDVSAEFFGQIFRFASYGVVYGLKRRFWKGIERHDRRRVGISPIISACHRNYLLLEPEGAGNQ